MLGKGVVLIAILVIAIVLMGLRMASQTRAAARNCYSEDQGPSTPTIC